LIQLRTLSARGYGERTLEVVAEKIGEPDLVWLTREYLHGCLFPDSNHDISELDDEVLPQICGKVSVFHSVVATYYAPSDRSRVNGAAKERIRSSPHPWHGGLPRHDCVVVEHNSNLPGFQGLYTARVHCFFTFKHQNLEYPSALVHWFETVGDSADPLTGMWVVKPEMTGEGQVAANVISIDSILRGVHLIPAFGGNTLPADNLVNPSNALDLFDAFYVNKYVAHHSHEILF